MLAKDTFRLIRRENQVDQMFTALDKKGKGSTDSVSNVSVGVPRGFDKTSSNRPRVTVDELKTELRHKFLTILKSCYWEFYEQG